MSSPLVNTLNVRPWSWALAAMLTVTSACPSTPSSSTSPEAATARDWTTVENRLRHDDPDKAIAAVGEAMKSPGEVPPHMAAAIAARLVDSTPTRTEQCRFCEEHCATCSGCWGMYGDSGCQHRPTVAERTRSLVLPRFQELRKETQAAIGRLAWAAAIQDRGKANEVRLAAGGMFAALKQHIADGLLGQHAETSLILLAGLDRAQCKMVGADGDLAAFLTGDNPSLRWSAAWAALACAGQGGPPLPQYVHILRALRARPEPAHEVSIDLGAPRAFAQAMGVEKHFDHEKALEMFPWTRRFSTLAGSDFRPLGKRLSACDSASGRNLLAVVTAAGTSARSLGDAVIDCYRRAPELAGLATIALSGIGAKQPRTLMQRLKRDYQAACAEHPCIPFEELSRTASKPGNPP